MSADSYHKRKLGNRVLQPETQMMGYGYDPKLSEGSLKPPIFLTSTFVFRNAQDGKDFFDYTSGRRQPPPGQAAGLVYSRFNNPNLEVLEDRLGLWEGGEAACVFSSGMSAISTTLWAYLKPNDEIVHQCRNGSGKAGHVRVSQGDLQRFFGAVHYHLMLVDLSGVQQLRLIDEIKLPFRADQRRQIDTAPTLRVVGH
jgi:cystathionine beta-lyase/cystathionine gamma-synthase